MKEYIHPPIGSRGHESYTASELVLVVGDEKVLAVQRNFFGYEHIGANVVIPGYIINFKKRKNEEDLLVSEVDPIIDEKERQEVIKAVQESGNLEGRIRFWE